MMVSGFVFGVTKLTATQFGMANACPSVPYASITRRMVSSTRYVSAPATASS